MDKKDMAIKGAKVALDVALMAIPAVQGVKTVNTMHKLAKCGKGMKMVATFTGNAQKANAIKALGNVGKAGLTRIAVEVLDKKKDKEPNLMYTNNFDYTGKYAKKDK